MNIDRLAINLRAYAYARGAPRKEDDEEKAMGAVRDIIAALSQTDDQPEADGLAGAHPDMEGHLADAIRDVFRSIAGKIVTFDESSRMARAALRTDRKAVLEAYERAAKVAEEDASSDWTDGIPRGEGIAAAIRKLAEGEAK